MKNFKNKKNRGKGFTLIEMMVSVSIFVIVAFIVVSTLLALSYAYKKAQKMRLLMDNLGFAMQSISLNIREGNNYNQSGCSRPNDCLAFKTIDNATPVCYSFLATKIKKCTSCPCNIGDTDMVAPEVEISQLSFYQTGDHSRNKVKIIIAGTAGKGRELTNFFIQNTVAQRNED